MSISTVTRSITLAVIISAYLSFSVANAQPDQASGKRRGPPPAALEACADRAEGDTCSFSGRRGDVVGSCIIPPQSQEELACAPEGGPPKDHREQ